ncbi:MAG: hypothetical protein LBV00_06160, partial [Propionibacteriaceae bacterium]|nr:hypothetical protein [Propionibacteriaceae bacterium]
MSNMQDRIDEYLDQSFGPYEDSPAVADLRIEVRHDLIERLADLLERQVPEEVAYAQVIASVGDMNATIRELAGVDQADADTDSGSDQAIGHQEP